MSRVKSKIRNQLFESKNSYALYRFLEYVKDRGVHLHRNKYPIHDIVVCGMQRSGSTLLFNIIREIVKTQFDKLDGHFKTDAEYRDLLLQEKSFYVKKTHQLLWSVVKRVESNTSIGFFTHRDVRDIIVSMIQKGWIHDLNKWLEEKRLHEIINNSFVYADTKNMHIFSYEDIIHKKRNIIGQIQSILSIDLGDDDVEKIIKETSIENVKKIMSSIDEHEEYDRTTHIHKDHIADAKVGKWKHNLSEEEISKINTISKEFLIKFGYVVS